MSSPLSDRAFRKVPIQVGKYTLLTRLASGGMGEVYVARMSAAAGFEKQVVIKRLLPELSRDEQFVRLFLDEARLTARLSHPNICQVFELTAIEEEYFLVMEYLEGLSLSTLFRSYSNRGLDLRIATGLITQACEGLQYAHEFRDEENGVQGIVHRDVTPHNLMLTVSGVVKLLDFGVAKLRREGHHTVTGSAKGKYAYMAPEQLHCEELDRRADLFAISVVLFELITGTRLFKRKSQLGTMKAIVDGERPLLHEVRSDVPPELSDIINRTLSVDREERFATARALSEAIRTAMLPLGGPASLGELSEYVREHHADELDEQRMLIKDATGRVRKVARSGSESSVSGISASGIGASGRSSSASGVHHPDGDEPEDLEATTIKPVTKSHPQVGVRGTIDVPLDDPLDEPDGRASSRSGRSSVQAIRRRLPLRAPTVTRAVDSLPGFEEDEDATVLDDSTAGALEAERISRRQIAVSPRPRTGSDIDIEPDIVIDYEDSVEVSDQLVGGTPGRLQSDLTGDLSGELSDDQLYNVDLRPKRRGRWLPIAGLLIAVAIALFMWQQSASKTKSSSKSATEAAASAVTRSVSESGADRPDRDTTPTSGESERAAGVAPATSADGGSGSAPGPDAGAEPTADAITDGDKAGTDKAGTDKARKDRRRKRRRDRDKKATAPSKFGYLTIDASPYAEIHIDSRKMGITPLVRVKLSVGEHKIRAVSAKGSKRMRVKISKDKTTKKRIVF